MPTQLRTWPAGLLDHLRALYETAGSHTAPALKRRADRLRVRLVATRSTTCNTIYSVAFSPDSRTLAAASAENLIHPWDLSDPQTPAAIGSLSGFTPITGATTALRQWPDGSIDTVILLSAETAYGHRRDSAGDTV